MDAISNKKTNTLARKAQQRLINKAPQRAHKEVIKDSMHNHGQASKLQTILSPARLKLSQLGNQSRTSFCKIHQRLLASRTYQTWHLPP